MMRDTGTLVANLRAARTYIPKSKVAQARMSAEYALDIAGDRAADLGDLAACVNALAGAVLLLCNEIEACPTTRRALEVRR
jgi:hypothetical protein